MWDEKLEFIDTIVQVNNKRVPLFAGATSLGTKETIRQMRGLQAVGADGAFVGLPLWQTPTINSAVRFYQDLSEAVPDFPVMVYSNSMFFKSEFPTPFWAGIGKKAPTVIITKLTYPFMNLLSDIQVAPQVNFMPGESSIYAAYKMARRKITTVWSSGAAGMGPEPMVALADAILRDDEKRVDEIWEDLQSVPRSAPPGEWVAGFPQYNIQINRFQANAAGYLKAGPSRVPYRLSDLPESWKKLSELRAKAWTDLRKKYLRRSGA